MASGSAETRFLTVREAGRRLGVHENTVRNWVAKGVLRSARAPGARFHRFEPSEIERVRLSHTKGPDTVQDDRRIVGPELADATRLNVWADTNEARYVFPRLARRLLAATPGVEDLIGRAGEGVGIAGWDLQATVPAATPWLPAGHLVFELGVGRSPRAKAQSEYEKRSAAPLGADPGETVFVFATPRRWPGAAAWAAEREGDGLWRGVRVLDGDAIEAWLEATPAVHYWISEQVGLNPHGVLSAERWWRQFSSRTRPVLPAASLMAGRGSERADLLAQLARGETPIGVRAAWRHDALGFVCAALNTEDEDAAPQRPALVIYSEDVWRRVVSEPGPMTLIPLFPTPDVAAATAGGKQVVVPFGADEAQSGHAIALPPPDRSLAREALRDAGVEFETADRLAALSRRSMPALIRRLSVNPNFAKPAWGHAPTSEIFAPLLLAGTWAESASDHAVVSELVDRSWADIERAVRAAAMTNDPPFVPSGHTWRVAAREEAFDVLSPSLTSGDLQRWASVAARVLLEQDPLAGLDSGQRLLASLEGTPSRASGTLRRGLADGLALLGSHGKEPLAGGTTCAQCAQTVVRTILDHAGADQTGRAWRSLSAELPLLAEAAPDLFLERVLAGSGGADPLLLTMFADGKATSAWDSSSPHTGLLWALETLCWSPDHLLDATRALAQLATIDPGGRLSNRPSASLGAVLVPWIRQTKAPLERRLAAIDQIVRDFPDVGWKLLESLWPSNHAATMPPASPRYRDWKPDHGRVPIPEWLAVISHVVNCALKEAGRDAERWAELVGRLGPLPPDHRDRIIRALDATAEDIVAEPDDRLLVWESLTKEVEHHRAFASAYWAMDEALLMRLANIAKRIEPSASVERHARLFDWHPDIGGLKYDGHEQYEAAVTELRSQIVRDTLESDSIDGLARLAERAPVPGHLGWVLAVVAGDDHRDLLLSWLTPVGKKSDMVRAWVRHRAGTEGVGWVSNAFRDLQDDDARLVLAFAAPPTPELWLLLRETSPELTNRYWEDLSPWGIAPGDVVAAATELLAHKRPWRAMTTIATDLHRHDGGYGAIEPGLVTRALEEALTSNEEPESRGDFLGYEIGKLLDFLEDRGMDTETLGRFEFAFFRALEDQRQPRALYAALSDHPELFVELVARQYHAKNAPRRTPDPGAAASATHAWHVLHEWRTVPGLREDGTINAEHLQRWVDRSRLILSDLDRADVGDEQIGQLLSGSPPGSDGAWPAEPIRDLIERLGSREMENGLHVGKLNARGVTTRDVYDGGGQERGLAAQFSDWSAMTAGRWPRTSRLLRELAESYEREAAREDMEAQEDADSE